MELDLSAAKLHTIKIFAESRELLRFLHLEIVYSIIEAESSEGIVLRLKCSNAGYLQEMIKRLRKLSSQSTCLDVTVSHIPFRASVVELILAQKAISDELCERTKMSPPAIINGEITLRYDAHLHSEKLTELIERQVDAQ